MQNGCLKQDFFYADLTQKKARKQGKYGTCILKSIGRWQKPCQISKHAKS